MDISQSDQDDFDKNNSKLIIGSSIMLVLYVVLAAAATFNTFRFVIGGRRYKNFHIAFFYLLVYIVIILRFLWLCVILAVVV